MGTTLQEHIVLICQDGVLPYKKPAQLSATLSCWALKAISDHAAYAGDFDTEGWVALQRMLLSLAASGYLGTRETQHGWAPQFSGRSIRLSLCRHNFLPC